MQLRRVKPKAKPGIKGEISGGSVLPHWRAPVSVRRCLGAAEDRSPERPPLRQL